MPTVTHCLMVGSYVIQLVPFTANVRYGSKGGATSWVIIHIPSLSIVVVAVSGRVLPRSICVQFHVPVINIIEEKSGLLIGTIVGAGAAICAVVATGDATRPIARATAPSVRSA